MNYDKILEEMASASLFELFRLKAAVDQQLEDPVRNKEIARRLKPGQEVQWFDPDENRLIDAVIVEVRRTRVSVKNKHDGKIWNLCFYYLNLDSVETDVHMPMPRRGLNRMELKVGDQVGFAGRNNEDVYGQITKLNPKRVLVRLQSGEKWYVYYSSLFRVIDGQQVLAEDVRLSHMNSNLNLPATVTFFNAADKETDIIDVH